MGEGMDGISCDACGEGLLLESDVRYVVRIEGFAAWLTSEIGVVVTPGNRFGPQGEGYVRLSTWPTFSELEQAMRRMKWLLNRNCESEGL